MFQLNKEEYYKILRCQIGTLELEQGKYSKYLPYVFTELGVAMLNSVLNSEIAICQNKKIMKAFISMRYYVKKNYLEQSYINNLVLENSEKISNNSKNIKLLQEAFDAFNSKGEEEYFSRSIYDAYSKVLDIFKEANKELIVVDRYTDKTILDMIRNLKCKVILITSKKTKLTKLDMEKYNSTYNNLTVIYDESYHDRYFIIDDDKVYHSGNSVNYIGYRKSSINVLKDKNIKSTIINDIKQIIEKRSMCDL